MAEAIVVPSPQEIRFKNAAIDLIGGSCGGIACVYVGQPFDTVKVKMQTFPKMYTGMLNCFRETLVKDGIIRGLYAGTTPAIVANVSENSVLFFGYGLCQEAMVYITGAKRVDELGVLSNATAGFFGSFLSSFTLCPTELVKCRLQAMRETHGTIALQHQNRLGAWNLVKQILRQDGIAGFFRGLTSTVAREMPGYFFFFGGYEASRTLLTPFGKKKEEIGPARTIISGGLGGMAFWLSVFPADSIKSRIQVSGSKESMTKVGLQIFRQEGFRTLYNGLGPTLVRTFPASGALFLAYETTKKLLHKYLDTA